MDYTIVHTLNQFAATHPLLVDTTRLTCTWIVPIVAVAAIIPWLVSGRGVDAPKRATAAGLIAAAVALGANQLLGALWTRPRPYATHPDGITPLAGLSHDPSFPSDHAAAAFAIAVAALIAYRAAGRVLILLAIVTAVSRVTSGAHYPSDVIAGGAVGAAAAVVVLQADRIWLPVVRAVARLTDPVIERVASVGVVEWLLDRRVRGRVVFVVGLLLTVRFAVPMRGHLLDEMPVTVLGAWLLCVGGALRLAAHQRAAPLALLRLTDSAAISVSARVQSSVKPNTSGPALREQRHVVPNWDGGWYVKKPGAGGVSSQHDSKEEAMDSARAILRDAGGGELTVHGRDGRIQSKATVPPADGSDSPPG